MTYEDFVRAVATRSSLPDDRAAELTRAVLSTLADRLTRGQAEEIAAQLPKGLKEFMVSRLPEAERFGLQDFVRHVSARAKAQPDEARRAVAATMTTLREAVSEGAFANMLAQLPSELRELDTAPPARP